MNEEFETALAEYQQRPTTEERRNLQERCYPLLRHVANAVYAKLPRTIGLDVDDLVSDGVPGAVAAIDGFDATKGCRFKTYAILRIRGAILDALRDRDWVPRLERLRASQGLVECRTMTSVEWGNRKTPDGTWNRATPPEPAAPADPGRTDDFWADMLRGCTQKERLILLLYWRQELTMKEIGQQLGLSESRVSRIHTGLLTRLKESHHESPRRRHAAITWRPVSLPAAVPRAFEFPPPDPSVSVAPRSVSSLQEPRMSGISSLAEQIQNLPLEEIDEEITQTQRRLELLQRMRSIITGAPAKASRRKQPDAPQPVTSEDGQALPYDDESVDRTERVRRFLKVHGPAGGNLIARSTNIPMGSITAVLSRTPGIARDAEGAWKLTDAA